MVHVGDKDVTHRMACAEGIVTMLPATLQVIKTGTANKGDVLGIARVAGIMAAKRTSELIPLCHGLSVEAISIDFQFVNETQLRIVSKVELHGKTGVEMEALTAVSIAGLTVYDMCKAIDRGMIMGNIRLVEKSGGKSGHYLVQ